MLRYLKELLDKNRQPLLTEHQRTHEWLALYLFHQNQKKWNDRPIYLAAGSEDLRALLNRIPLDLEGDEAFIVIRPYIHTMLLSLKRIDGKLIGCLFDSQAWGTRYDPTRWILQALTDTYPKCSIYLSQRGLQSKDNQSGCESYTLACLDELLKPESAWMKMLPKLELSETESVPGYAQVNLLKETLCPPNLEKSLVEELDVLVANVLEAEYVVNEEINWSQIEEVVNLMQGMDLVPLTQNESVLGDIKVDLNAAQVTLTLPSDYIYANLIFFTAKLYPCKDPERCLFDRNERVKVKHDANKNQICFQAESVSVLTDDLTECAQNPHRYASEYMRQQLGLKVLLQQVINQIKLECDLKLMRNANYGGLFANQVQGALYYLFRDNKSTVYVPLIDELVDAKKINLKTLGANGIDYLISSLPEDNNHIISIKIDLTGDEYICFFYNSQEPDSIKESLKRRIKDLFGDIKIQSAPLHFNPQTHKDIWACGVHAIANLEASFGKITSTDILDVNHYLHHYLRAFYAQTNEFDQQYDESRKRFGYYKLLLELLTKIQPPPTDLLYFIEHYLLQETFQWMQIKDILLAYKTLYPENEFGYQLLRFALLKFPHINEKQLRLFIEGGCIIEIAYTWAKYESGLELIIDEKTFWYAQSIRTDLQLELNGRRAPLKYLKHCLSVLLNSDEALLDLKAFFKIIGAEYPIESSHAKLRIVLVHSICALAMSFAEEAQSAQKLQERGLLVQLTRKKHLLAQMGITNEDSPEVCDLLKQSELELLRVSSSKHQFIIQLIDDPSDKAITLLAFVRCPRLHDVKQYERQLFARCPQELLPKIVESCWDNDAFKSRGFLLCYKMGLTSLEDIAALAQSPAVCALTKSMSVEEMRKTFSHLSHDKYNKFLAAHIVQSKNSVFLFEYLACTPVTERTTRVTELILMIEASFLIDVITILYGWGFPFLLSVIERYELPISEEQTLKIIKTISMNIVERKECLSLLLKKTNCKIDIETLFKYASEEQLQLILDSEVDVKLGQSIANSTNAIADSGIGWGFQRDFIKKYKDYIHMAADVLRLLDLNKRKRRHHIVKKYPLTDVSFETILECAELLDPKWVLDFLLRHTDKVREQNDIFRNVGKLSRNLLQEKEFLIFIEANIDKIKQKVSLITLIIYEDVHLSYAFGLFQLFLPTLSTINQILGSIWVSDQYTKAYAKELLLEKHVKTISMLLGLDTSYLFELETRLGLKFIKSFVKKYLGYFKTQAEFSYALDIEFTATLDQLKEKPLNGRYIDIKAFKILFERLHQRASYSDLYQVLILNLTLITNWKDLCWAIRFLSDGGTVTFLGTPVYQAHVLMLYLQDQSNSIISLPTYQNWKIIEIFIPHLHLSEELLYLFEIQSIPEKEKLVILLQHIDKFTSIDSLLKLNRHVPDTSLLDIYLKRLDVINSETPTKKFALVSTLPRASRFPLIKKMQIDDNDEFKSLLMNILIGEDQWEFIRTHVSFNSKSSLKLEALKRVGRERVLELALRTISTADEMGEVMKRHKGVDLLPFISQRHHLITHDNLLTILHAGSFAWEYIFYQKAELIDSPDRMVDALKQVDFRIERKKYASLFIKDYQWLVAAMSVFQPLEDQPLLLLEQHRDKVTNKCNIGLCLTHLAAEFRLEKALNFKEFICSSWQYRRVIQALDAKDRYEFVNAFNTQKVKFKEWINLLSPIERYDYFSKMEFADEQLQDIVCTLDVSARLMFLCDNINRIKNKESLGDFKVLLDKEQGALLEHKWNKNNQKFLNRFFKSKTEQGTGASWNTNSLGPN